MDSINEKFIARVIANDLIGVAELLEAGANVHYVDNYALRLSVQNGALDMIVKLLEYNADPNAAYILRRSIDNKRLDIVTKLLEFGADVNPLYNSFAAYSVLEAGVHIGNLEMVNKLLEYGADLHSCDDYALQMSIKRHYFEITATLLEHGANIWCDKKCILKDLQVNFNEKIADIVVRNVPFLPSSLIHETKVSLLRLVLPYCDTSDHEYFPSAYIRSRLIPIKSARAIVKRDCI